MIDPATTIGLIEVLLTGGGVLVVGISFIWKMKAELTSKIHDNETKITALQTQRVSDRAEDLEAKAQRNRMEKEIHALRTDITKLVSLLKGKSVINGNFSPTSSESDE